MYHSLYVAPAYDVYPRVQAPARISTVTLKSVRGLMLDALMLAAHLMLHALSL